MLTNPFFSNAATHTYERIGHRIMDIIADPKVQRRQCVTVRRLDDEDPESWRKLISELSATSGVRVENLGCGLVQIAWNEYYDC